MKIYTYDNKVMTVGGKWMEQTTQPGPEPGPTLPPYTIRLKFTEGVMPSFNKGTGVHVSSSPNVWDLTYENTDWTQLCYLQPNLIEVIGANTTGVTSMAEMFGDCSALTTVPMFDTSSVTDMNNMFAYCEALTAVPQFDTSSVTDMQRMLYYCSLLTTAPLFDTSKVTNIESMFEECQSLTTVPLFDTSSAVNLNNMLFNCSSLTSVPLFDTSKVTSMNSMFANCYNVESGALALYQQASSQATPPSSHSQTFFRCGRDTTTGAAELAQIPTSWGGTMT